MLPAPTNPILMPHPSVSLSKSLLRAHTVAWQQFWTLRRAGAVVIANLTTPVTADGLSFESAFQRTYLKDNAVVLAVDSNNMTVQYFAQVDGSLLVSEQYTFDYNQIDAAELGLDKNLIRDQFNGEMFAVNNEYFASVRRNDNTFLMVLHPLVFIDSANLLSVIFATAAALLFFIGLVWMAGRLGKASAEEAGETDLPEAEQAPAKGPAQVPDEDRAEGEVFALLGKLANREKFDFKTRWPSDGKKWKDKNQRRRIRPCDLWPLAANDKGRQCYGER
jgi:hypothetical protein